MSSANNPYQAIRRGIAEGNTEAAFTLLEEAVKEQPTLQTDVLLLRNRFANWQRDKLIHGDPAGAELSRIHEALLSLVDQLEHPDRVPASRNTNPWLIRSVFGIIGLGVVVLLLWLLVGPSVETPQEPTTFPFELQFQGPAGPQDLPELGRVEVRLGDFELGTKTVTADGKVIFPSVPMAYASDTLGIRFPGQSLQIVDQTAISPEDTRLIIVTLKARGTLYRGTVLHQGQTVRGAQLDFDAGRAAAQTDENGNFEVLLPVTAGTPMEVRISLDGELRSSRTYTITDAAVQTLSLE